MSKSFLIIGGKQTTRREKADEIAQELRVSQLDTFILESPTSLGIDQVRNLKNQLALKPYNSPVKLALIPTAEKLTIEAQNALLKTLEEPPENTFLLLCAPNVQNLLPTVVSRCQVVELPPQGEIELSEEEFQNQLSAISYLLIVGVGEKLKMAQTIAQGRLETTLWLDYQTLTYRKIMLKKYLTRVGDLTSNQLLTIFEKINKTKEMIEANVNPRFALECFLLNLPTYTQNTNL